MDIQKSTRDTMKRRTSKQKFSFNNKTGGILTTLEYAFRKQINNKGIITIKRLDDYFEFYMIPVLQSRCGIIFEKVEGYEYRTVLSFMKENNNGCYLIDPFDNAIVVNNNTIFSCDEKVLTKMIYKMYKVIIK